jgi:hypothetical protein
LRDNQQGAQNRAMHQSHGQLPNAALLRAQE